MSVSVCVCVRESVCVCVCVFVHAHVCKGIIEKQKRDRNRAGEELLYVCIKLLIQFTSFPLSI